MDPMPALHSGEAPDPEILPDVANDLDRRGHARNVKVMRVARLKDMKLHAEYLGRCAKLECEEMGLLVATESDQLPDLDEASGATGAGAGEADRDDDDDPEAATKLDPAFDRAGESSRS